MPWPPSCQRAYLSLNIVSRCSFPVHISVSNESDVASDAQQGIAIFPGNASWRPTCEHFLQVDDECAKHKSNIFWTQEQRTAIKSVFTVFGCIAIILNIITAYVRSMQKEGVDLNVFARVAGAFCHSPLSMLNRTVAVYFYKQVQAGPMSSFHIILFLCICDTLRYVSLPRDSADCSEMIEPLSIVFGLAI